jgi:hypothetical protein
MNRVLSAQKYNWDALFPGDINAETWLFRLGESQMRQEDMVSARLGPESNSAGKAQKQFHGEITDPSSRQRGRPTTRNPQISVGNKNHNFNFHLNFKPTCSPPPPPLGMEAG